MNNDPQAARERRLQLARQTFDEFFAQCFWSWSEEAEITDDTIPLIIEGLRHYGGHRGYQIAAQLCQ